SPSSSRRSEGVRCPPLVARSDGWSTLLQRGAASRLGVKPRLENEWMDAAGQECELDLRGDLRQLAFALPNLASAGGPDSQVTEHCAAVLESFEPQPHRISVRGNFKEPLSDKLSGDPPVQVSVALQLVGTESVVGVGFGRERMKP